MDKPKKTFESKEELFEAVIGMKTLVEEMTKKQLSKEDVKTLIDEKVKSDLEAMKPKSVSFNVLAQDEEGKEIEGITEYGKQFKGVSDFVSSAARIGGDYRLKTSSIMNIGTDAQGGYAVPVEYATSIISLIRDYSYSMQLATILPMTTQTRRLPNQATNPTVGWVDESGIKTTTKPTLGAITQVAKKLAVIVRFTDELLADNNVAIDTWVRNIIAKAFALETDRVAFVGNTVAGDPFMGIRYTAAVVNTPMVGGSLVWQDLVNMIIAVPTAVPFNQDISKKAGNAVWLTNGVGFGIISKLADANNRPIFDPVSNKVLGYPIAVTNQITAIAAAQPLIFGDYKEGLIISPREGMAVLPSQHASDPTNNESAYLQDETWLRFLERKDISVKQPQAFTYSDIK